jgi:hypothetical protein
VQTPPFQLGSLSPTLSHIVRSYLRLLSKRIGFQFGQLILDTAVSFLTDLMSRKSKSISPDLVGYATSVAKLKESRFAFPDCFFGLVQSLLFSE